ncbi:Ig-like domain-containing protein, partial [Candidatus Bathyarchaeota archaeon]|nr:Ig-like domain-containing protein [Candidatus Bathyarchaeota archaeon]
FRFSDMRISCESAGVDMRKIFTMPNAPVSEETSGENNVFYYMSLLAEYFEGEIEFYMKTDYRAVNLTLIDPPEVGYTGDTTIIKVETESATKVDSMWLEYSIDSWKTKKTITLIEKPDYWLAALPSFELHDDVQYKIYAEDEIDNRGLYTGSFTVMNKVELDFGISSSVVQGGQTVKLTGAATRPSINLVLNIEQGGATQKINIQTDGDGVFSYDYKPTKIGEHDVTISYAGDEDYHSAVSREKSFRVDKRKLDLTCELGAAPYKNERTLTITGQVTPSVSGLDVEIMFVSPDSSFIETVTTGREGGFSLTITPEVIGTWDMLPQLKVSELYDASQGFLISFEVVNLTPVDIIVYKAMAFTTPPLMYVPIGLAAALVAVLLMRTDFVKKRLNKEDEEEEAASEEETPKGATGYKRRSSR